MGAEGRAPDVGSWAEVLAPAFRTDAYRALSAFVSAERERSVVYPSGDDELRALRETDRPSVRVVLLGQDPYHGPGQADGLAFSVRSGVKPPPSLRNLFRELVADLGCRAPASGDLTAWARAGVLLLNTTLTVRQGEPLSHQRRGWETFTDEVVRAVDTGPPCVFLLLGSHAQKRGALVDHARHRVIAGVHPSPLSASRGFFGSRPFLQINEALSGLGREPVDFRLP